MARELDLSEHAEDAQMKDLLFIILLCLLACLRALGQASGSGTIVGSGGTSAYYPSWGVKPEGYESVFGGDEVDSTAGTVGFVKQERDPCDYIGRYDASKDACVVVIRFDKGLKDLVCTNLESSAPIDEEESMPKDMNQQITCMYDSNKGSK